MRTEYGAGAYHASWSSKSEHLDDLEGILWLLALGLSLTALVCASGYAEIIGSALAISG